MNVNILKTKEYYNTLLETDLCDCGYCRNYRTEVKSAYPNVATYLESLGIDINKTFETSPLEVDERGMLDYLGCQYIVFGNSKIDYYHKIDDVEFRIATSYPKTNIKEEHFVLELFPIRLIYNQ